jgi:hypothetical protein
MIEAQQEMINEQKKKIDAQQEKINDLGKKVEELIQLMKKDNTK